MLNSIDQYIQNQISRAPIAMKSFTHDENSEPYLTRNIFIRIKKLLNDVLAQLFMEFFPKMPDRILYISADQIVNTLGNDLSSAFDSFQKFLGVNFESLEKPLFIFIDEVHFDPKWPSILKSIYDRSKQIFVLCTGSSALSLQSSTDLARRVVFEKLYPMNFTEYMLLKTKYESIKDKTIMIKYPVKGLKEAIKNALFYSASADECFSRLTELKTQINKYWFSIDSLEIDKYLRFGTMPYALTIKDEQRIFTLINQQIDRVVERDLPDLGKFDTAT